MVLYTVSPVLPASRFCKQPKSCCLRQCFGHLQNMWPGNVTETVYIATFKDNIDHKSVLEFRCHLLFWQNPAGENDEYQRKFCLATPFCLCYFCFSHNFLDEETASELFKTSSQSFNWNKLVLLENTLSWIWNIFARRSNSPQLNTV